MTLALLLLAGFFLPLYPLSVLPNALLQGQLSTDAAGRSGRRPGPGSKIAVLLIFPIVGVGLATLAMNMGASETGLPALFGIWGGLTSVLYAFRLLSARMDRSGSRISSPPRSHSSGSASPTGWIHCSPQSGSRSRLCRWSSCLTN